MTKAELTKLAISWVCPNSKVISTDYERKTVDYMVRFAQHVLLEVSKEQSKTLFTETYVSDDIPWSEH